MAGPFLIEVLSPSHDRACFSCGVAALDRYFELWDAVQRCVRSEVAVFALVVDAKDDQAETFYGRHGFVSFGRQPRQLVLPLTNLIVKG